MNLNRYDLLFLALYTGLLFLLVGRLPFWLDELLELRLIKDHPLVEICKFVPQNRGGVPIDYLIRGAFVKSLGFSRLVARAPSMLSSVFAVYLLIAEGKRLMFRFTWLPALLFCTIPLQLRYAVEARPYGPALDLVVLGTFILFRLFDRPKIAFSVILMVVATFAALTQPFALFPLAGYALWAFMSRQESRRHVFLSICLPLILSAVLFGSWCLWSSQFGGDTTRYPADPKAFAVLFRELIGGYPGTVLIVGCAAFGFVSLRANRKPASIWVLGAVSTISLALVADFASHYFFAARQVIFAIPALCVLAAAGLESLWRRRPVIGICFGVVVFACLFYSDIRFFLGPREDWGEAALAAQRFAAGKACVSFAPPESEQLFTFFVPKLSELKCDSRLNRRVVAFSPYKSNEALELESMSAQGFRLKLRQSFHGPQIEVYERR